jgi:hypothetical protein
VFWIRFQLRPENKIKHKNYDKTLYIQYELALTNANKGVLNQTIQDLSAYNACVTYFWYNHSFVIVVYVVSLKQIDMGNWLFCMDYRLVIDVLSIMTDWYHNIFRCVRCYSEYQVQVMGRVYYVGWATSSRAIVRIHFTLYACFQNKIK